MNPNERTNEDISRISDRLVKMTDSRINDIYSLVQEIHQRQQEKTIPAIEKIEKTLYGNGKKGLCEEVTELKVTNNNNRWFIGIGIAVMGILLAVGEILYRSVK